ncbi:F-box protein At2g39490-like isoform X2 [Cornus florida]|uniref:F-box protein At2g39490-like isoform X2 n=1 Tax=Cornus florida TaxID=4283 RepID=UPI0028A15534|nr:F-box protein At2g39490-like isoform X2 [Cornus florida]
MGKKHQKKKKNRRHQQDPSLNKRRNNLLIPDNLNAQKFSVVENVADDLISKLPNEILFRILTLIPFDSAVKMIKIGALSTRLNDLWTLVQHGAEVDIKSALADFLNRFDELDPLKNPRRLQFHFGLDQILLASIGLNRKLHLDFSEGKQELPRQFRWQLGQSRWNLFCNKHPSFTLVKTLKLTSVNYLIGDTVSSIISRLFFLENLTLRKCNGLQSLRIEAHRRLQSLCIEDIPGLQYLIVLDCLKLQCLYIKACKLQYLQISGGLPRFYLEGYFSLEDAMFDFRKCPYKQFNGQYFDSLLQRMINVERLTLCRWTFEEFGMAWSRKVRFKRLKDLWWIDNSMNNYDNIFALFSFLKMCPSLERLFITIDHPASFWMQHATWDSKLITRNVQLNHLKVVKLEGLRDEEDVIFLAENFLAEFNVRPQIIVASHRKLLRRLLRIPQQLGKGNLREAASQTQKRKYFYKFVKDVEDHTEPLRHPHMSL